MLQISDISPIFVQMAQQAIYNWYIIRFSKLASLEVGS